MSKEQISELTLMLLYLTSWTENERGLSAYQRSWKGYDFDILNELSDQELITDVKRSKSVGITSDGIAKARELLKKYVLEE